MAGLAEIGPDPISNRRLFVHHSRIPGIPVDINGLGINMRKAALLAAVIVAAAFSAISNVSVAQTDPNPNTTKLIQDAVNPYVATSKPAEPAKKAKKKAKKKM